MRITLARDVIIPEERADRLAGLEPDNHRRTLLVRRAGWAAQGIDVDPEEAQALIRLIEVPFEEWYIALEQRAQHLASIVSIADTKKNQKATLEQDRANLHSFINFSANAHVVASSKLNITLRGLFCLLDPFLHTFLGHIGFTPVVFLTVLYKPAT